MPVGHDRHDRDPDIWERLQAYLIAGPELELLVDLAKKLAVFLGIFVVGITLSSVADFLKRGGWDPLLSVSAKVAADLVMLCDIAGFSVYVMVSTGRFIFGQLGGAFVVAGRAARWIAAQIRARRGHRRYGE